MGAAGKTEIGKFHLAIPRVASRNALKVRQPVVNYKQEMSKAGATASSDLEQFSKCIPPVIVSCLSNAPGWTICRSN